MSIVNMHKVTFIGMTADRDRLLNDLQRMGCVQIIPLASGSAAHTEAAHTAGAREALKFLHTYPQRRRQVLDKQRFDAVKVQQRTLEVRTRLHDLENERDFLIKRIQDMRPWGDFTFPSLQEMGNQRLWFYVVPHKDLPAFEMVAPVREIIRRDNRFCYVAVVAEKEPSEMPVARIHLGSKPRHELEARLDDVELAIEDAQAERAYLTRWHDLLRHDLNRLEDQAIRQSAAAQVYSNDRAFALQGWAPEDSLPALKALFERTGILLCSRSAHSRRQPAYTHAQSIVAKRRRGFGYFLHDPWVSNLGSLGSNFRFLCDLFCDDPGRCGLCRNFRNRFNADVEKAGPLVLGQPFSSFTFVGGSRFLRFLEHW